MTAEEIQAEMTKPPPSGWQPTYADVVICKYGPGLVKLINDRYVRVMLPKGQTFAEVALSISDCRPVDVMTQYASDGAVMRLRLHREKMLHPVFE